MIISLENARRWYDQQKRKVEKGKKGKVVIFVSHSIDSLTSLRILVGLFKSDNIPYEIIPVENFEELREHLIHLKEKEASIKGLVMINCVGDNELTKFWFCQEENHCDFVCLVVDSRRPASHRNINQNGTILYIDDNSYGLENCPTNEEMEEFQNLLDNFEDDNLEEMEEDEVDNKEGDNKKGKIKKKKTELDTIAKDGDEGNEIDNIAQSALVNEDEENQEETKNEKLRKKKEEFLKKRMKIQSYYSGSFYGLPSTYVFYNIAYQLHREDTYYLWYLIVAITDEYLRYHLTQKNYDLVSAFCIREMNKVNTQKKKLKKEEEENDKMKFKSTGKEVKVIENYTDYRIMLFRHWNLFDSFVYSDYTMGVLTTWREQGKSELQKLFAFMGIPLAETKQKYRYMKSEFKTSFHEKIKEIGAQFGLNELLFHSFIYQFDQNTEMSASDCVYLLSAVIEYPFETINDIEIVDDDLDINEAQNENDEDENRIIKEGNKKENSLKKFWLAYCFLSLKKLNMTNSLIDLAIKFQISLSHAASTLIDKRGIVFSNQFRYSIINSNLTDESRYFHYPCNLERLCLLISQTFYRTRIKEVEFKPYLLAMLDADNKTYILDGNLGCNKEYDDQKNEMGIQFKYVAKKLGIELQYNYNSDEIVTINKDDLFAFIQELSSIDTN